MVSSAQKHPKMPLEKRAKQFMPFAALNGLDEALRRKEWEVETRLKQKDPRYTTLCEKSQEVL